jgi:hypothetical protein
MQTTLDVVWYLGAFAGALAIAFAVNWIWAGVKKSAAKAAAETAAAARASSDRIQRWNDQRYERKVELAKIAGKKDDEALKSLIKAQQELIKALQEGKS